MSWRYVAVAADAATRAGAIQKERYGQGVKVDLKGDIDLVTEVDHACEGAILEVIRSRCPDHDIITEETDLDRSGSPYVWIIDPLDGTTNFAHSYPMFSTSIALARDGEVVAGAVFDPLRDELFTAERGAGAHLNGGRLSVTTADKLLESLVITGFPYDVHEKLAERARPFIRVLGRARAVRRGGSAALDLSYVAAGRADGFWECLLKPWDMGAGRLMIEEAGGRVSRFDGSPLGLGPDEVLGTNGHIHEEIMAVLSEASDAEATLV